MGRRQQGRHRFLQSWVRDGSATRDCEQSFVAVDDVGQSRMTEVRQHVTPHVLSQRPCSDGSSRPGLS